MLGKPVRGLHIQQMVCNFSLTPAHALGQHGTPGDARLRAQGAARLRVAVLGKRIFGRFWRKRGCEDGVQGLQIEYSFGNFSFMAAYSCGHHNTPGASGRRAHSAANMCVAV